jgi:hypothetical protein
MDIPSTRSITADVIDVMPRRGVNFDSDHIMLVVIKFRAEICRASNTKPQQLKRFAVDRLKDRDVAYHGTTTISSLNFKVCKLNH